MAGNNAKRKQGRTIENKAAERKIRKEDRKK